MSRTERLEIEGVPLLATLEPGRGDIGLLALHGSGEGGTAQLAGSVARRCGVTSLVFTQPDTAVPVHLPSPRMAVDHCALLHEFRSRVSLTVSLHGHLRQEAWHTLFLGGANRAASLVLARELAVLEPRFRIVTDLEEIPAGLRGLHARNPVNLTRLAGVQVELPLPARTTGASDDPPQAVVDAFVAGVGRLAQALPTFIA
ncbi:poly-gamma-glutamate hydrolase family protein [Streptomyces sp. CoH27]|uniref:poly-gamma-glutamate hydrolase family protein n=1 Tax=Streptomyces sp. CoH27 TaxID=2875763 RepID=UPI001CD33BBA|nr:poly-gamma-glutamate hydrolase family protein [Streptomyces sp. CoH27]